MAVDVSCSKQSEVAVSVEGSKKGKKAKIYCPGLNPRWFPKIINWRIFATATAASGKRQGADQVNHSHAEGNLRLVAIYRGRRRQHASHPTDI
jgi:hypothetical protein